MRKDGHVHVKAEKIKNILELKNHGRDFHSCQLPRGIDRRPRNGKTLAERILRAGTPLCWVIWPERRQAWQYGKDRLSEAKEELVADLADSDCVRISLAELGQSLIN